MGFDQKLAAEALLANSGNVMQAVNWCIENPNGKSSTNDAAPPTALSGSIGYGAGGVGGGFVADTNVGSGWGSFGTQQQTWGNVQHNDNGGIQFNVPTGGSSQPQFQYEVPPKKSQPLSVEKDLPEPKSVLEAEQILKNSKLVSASNSSIESELSSEKRDKKPETKTQKKTEPEKDKIKSNETNDLFSEKGINFESNPFGETNYLYTATDSAPGNLFLAHDEVEKDKKDRTDAPKSKIVFSKSLFGDFGKGQEKFNLFGEKPGKIEAPATAAKISSNPGKNTQLGILKQVVEDSKKSNTEGQEKFNLFSEKPEPVATAPKVTSDPEQPAQLGFLKQAAEDFKKTNTEGQEKFNLFSEKPEAPATAPKVTSDPVQSAQLGILKQIVEDSKKANTEGQEKFNLFSEKPAKEAPAAAPKITSDPEQPTRQEILKQAEEDLKKAKAEVEKAGDSLPRPKIEDKPETKKKKSLLGGVFNKLLGKTKADPQEKAREEARKKAEADEKKRLKEEKQRRETLNIARKAQEKRRKAKEDRLKKKALDKKKWIEDWLCLGSGDHMESFLDLVGQELAGVGVGLGFRERIKNMRKMAAISMHPQESLFLDELDERVDTKTLPKEIRRKLAPELWRFRHSFSLTHFTAQLEREEAKCLAAAKRRGEIAYPGAFPVLSEFLGIEPSLRALRYLPSVLRFQTILIPRITRTLDMSSARKITVKDAIHTYTKGSSEKRACIQAFEGYVLAWKEIWASISTFLPPLGEEVGEPIPAKYRTVEISMSSPITLFLTSDREEGRCAGVLTATLTNRHNDFIKSISSHLKNTGQGMLQGSGSAAKGAARVSPRFFSEAMSLSYDIETKFLPFVAKQCVDHTEEGGTVYNFSNAQQYLLDSFFIGKPLVDAGADDAGALSVQYADDTDAIDVQALTRRVPQEAMTKDLKDSVLSEIKTGAQALKCLNILETVISFVSATVSASIGDVKVAIYMRETLLIQQTLGSNSIENRVCLKHLASLWATLRSLLVKNRFQDVHLSYKQPLDAKTSMKIKTELANALTEPQLKILTTSIESQIATVLSEGTMDPCRSAADFIGLGEHDGVFLRDAAWFKNFPKDVPLGCVVDLFKVVESALKEKAVSI
ncbi:hypothetical protein AAMO2058_000248300 [Amorphochlora amoebiformis]